MLQLVDFNILWALQRIAIEEAKGTGRRRPALPGPLKCAAGSGGTAVGGVGRTPSLSLLGSWCLLKGSLLRPPLCSSLASKTAERRRGVGVGGHSWTCFLLSIILRSSWGFGEIRDDAVILPLNCPPRRIHVQGWCSGPSVPFWIFWLVQILLLGFLRGSVAKNPSAMQEPHETWGSIPGSGRFPEGGNGNALQYSCLGNHMDRGASQATVRGVTKETDITEQLNNSNNNLSSSSLSAVLCLSLFPG